MLYFSRPLLIESTGGFLWHNQHFMEKWLFGKTAAILALEILFEIWTILTIFCFFPLSWILIPFLNLQISDSVKLHVIVLILENVGVRRQMRSLPVFQYVFNIFHWKISASYFALIMGKIQQNCIYYLSFLMTFSALVIVNQVILGFPEELFTSFRRLTIGHNFCSWLNFFWGTTILLFQEKCYKQN